MDVSSSFKTCVNLAKLYSEIAPDQVIVNTKKRKKQSLFATKCRNIVNQIAKLYGLLIEYHQEYLNSYNYFSNKTSTLALDCNTLDSLAKNIIEKCTKLIAEVKNDASINNLSEQNEEHRRIVILSIETYLKQVCKSYSEWKAIEVRKAIELKSISKLESIKQTKLLDTNTKPDGINNCEDCEENTDVEICSSKVQEINYDDTLASQHEEQLSSEDIQIFEAENDQLYNELNTLSEEIKQIESRVVNITQLQDIFTEKILDQDKNLEHVLTTVIGSTENVKEANEQIRKAIQRNAGLRVWVLFFLLVMSFSLIFLDWYNL